MTVKELIKQLQLYPGGMEVGFACTTCRDTLDVEVLTTNEVRMKEVYFDPKVNEFLLADDDAFDRDEDVENRVILS